MEKRWIVIGIIFLGVVGFFLFRFGTDESFKESKQIFCPDYDENQQECLSHLECEWIADENICNSFGMIDEGEFNDDEIEGEIGLVQELETIEIPNNPSNELCKKIPLSGNPPYGERYQCLAIVNSDERFCEGIDEEKEKNMCLAYAKKDSSYCEKVEGQDSKHTCYYMLAVSSENADFCGGIDYSQHEKEQCYFNFMSNLYQWGKSNEIRTEYCNQLDTPDKNTCLALKAKDISMCGDNPWCLTFFEQPLSFCDEHPEMKDCMKDRAKTSRDVSICELLLQPERDSCIGAYCTHTELNVNICDMIENTEERQDRYLELAMNLGNL